MGTSLTGLTPATTYDALIKTGDNAPIDATLKTLSDGLGNNLPMEVSTTGVNFTNQLQQGGVAVPTAAQVSAKQDTLVSGTNIKTINGTSVLGSGDIVTPTTPPSGVSGAIQFSNGSAFASDAANLFWDNTNKRLGVGTNSPLTNLQVVGSIYVNSGSNLSNGLSIGDTLSSSKLVYYSGGLYFKIFGTDILNINTTGLSVGSSSQATTRFQIKGSGSTSATTSLLVQNSAGTQLLKVADNGDTIIGISTANINVTPTFGTYISSNGGTYIIEGGTYKMVINSVGASIGKGASGPVASAQLEMVSTTQGFLPPRMTTTQKNAIATPAAGLVVYDSTTNKLCCYNGSTWNDLF